MAFIIFTVTQITSFKGVFSYHIINSFSVEVFILLSMIHEILSGDGRSLYLLLVRYESVALVNEKQPLMHH